MNEADKIAALIEAEQLPPEFAHTIDICLRPLAARITEAHRGPMLLVGICGPQGSGKSTIAAFLKQLLKELGKRAEMLSIDDLYLTRDERLALARDIHPLFATRGPPGTHDIELGLSLVARLKSAAPGTITRLPHFDKSRDDRAPERDWTSIAGRPDILLFEGWCVGARPEPEASLAEPINELERTRDTDGTWRRAVNAYLANYQALFGKIALLIMLKPPGFENVLQWRMLQEDKLRALSLPGARVMSPAEIAKFIMHYERITRRALKEMPDRADIVLDLDATHGITGMRERPES